MLRLLFLGNPELDRSTNTLDFDGLAVYVVRPIFELTDGLQRCVIESIIA